MATKDAGAVMERGEVSNGAAEVLGYEQPYIARLKLTGTADIFFHRWNVESIDGKSKAPKGSAAKKKDDVESYVWRDEEEYLCVPGEYLRQSIINAAKYRQDPRSPRKSAMDLFKAGVTSLTPLARLGPHATKKWEFEDSRRVKVQQAGVTRVRPCMKVGWTADIQLLVLLPEYISAQILHEVANQAGRLCGLGDNRPTYGRFLVSQFSVLKEP